ncbi:hypothetical protein [Devosia sp.]|jgi:hypothetical protein|uniref:glycoside hydrolase family 38 N-terminal domain-containing protein n=1 Tax=Devosia sp. TaxID=1871048 RepID=UPI0037BEEDC1
MAVDTLCLVNHTHTDFGYTDHAESLFRQQRRIIDKAIEVCEREAGRGEASRFRWTCEVTETTLRWLRAAQPGQVDRFMALHRAGLLGVGAMPMHWTPLISPALAERSLDQLRTLRAEYGIEARTAWQCDVNGLAWHWTDLLLDAGVERLLMASNPYRGMSDLLAPHYFNWETPSGRHLPTLHGWHYTYGTLTWHFSQGDLAKSQRDMDRVLDRVERAGVYPYSTVLAQVTNAASPDNGFPTEELPDFVERWNAEGRHPKLEIATLDQAFDKLHASTLAGPPLPSLSGDWPDYWADGVASTAHETAIARSGERLIPVADMLNALHPGADTEALDQAVQDITLYDEHTWGAYCSTDLSQSPFTRFQWSWKTERAQQGFATALEALTTAARSHARSVTGEKVEGDIQFRRNTPPKVPIEQQAYYVFNPTGAPRRVHWPLTHDLGGAAPATILNSYVCDRFLPGMDVERFGFGHSQDHVIAVDLPAWGQAVVRPSKVEKSELSRCGENWIETKNWRLSVNPADGTIAALIDKASGRDVSPSSLRSGLVVHETLVDESHRRNALFAYDVDAADWSKLESLVWPNPKTAFNRVTGTVTGVGAGRATLMGAEIDVDLAWPHGETARVTYRLPFDGPGVEVTIALEKQRIETTEAFYMIFAATGDRAEVKLDIGDHVVDAATQQLDRGCRTWASVQRYAALATSEMALVVASPDAPLVQPFGLQTEEAGGRRLDGPELAFQLVNNHWNVNFAASQSGRITARFHLLPQSEYLEGEAILFAAQACTPPVVVRAYGAELKAPAPLFDVSSDAAVEIRLRTTATGDAVRLTVVNAAHVINDVRFSIPGFAITGAQSDDAINLRGVEPKAAVDGGSVSLQLAPHQRCSLNMVLSRTAGPLPLTS